MSENTDPMNAGPDPIQLPSQDPALAPAAEGTGSPEPKSSRRTLQAALAGGAAVALLAVAGVTGFAIGASSDNHDRGDGPGMSGVEANGVPGEQDGMRGGPDGMRDGDRDGRQGPHDGDGRGHRDGGGQGMPGRDNGASSLPALPSPTALPSLPALPSTPATPHS